MKAAEIGIGHFPDIAVALLKKGMRVFATDIRSFSYEGLEVVIDDVTEPDISRYGGADLVYSIKPPMELVPYMKKLARALPADLIVKPLSSEYPGGILTKYRDATFYLWKQS
jgi:uncharacterized UPF0146 family protein